MRACLRRLRLDFALWPVAAEDDLLWEWPVVPLSLGVGFLEESGLGRLEAVADCPTKNPGCDPRSRDYPSRKDPNKGWKWEPLEPRNQEWQQEHQPWKLQRWYEE